MNETLPNPTVRTRFSLMVTVLLSFILVITSLLSNSIFTKQSNVITWDVYGYYLYLPATFIYHDTKEYKFTQDHLQQYRVASDIYQLNPISENVKAPVYTMGLAILWSPFFFVAHGYSTITHAYPADGLSFPYQLAVIIASWFYAILGLFFLRKALLRFFRDTVVAFTLFAIVLGTNYYHYACFESGMPHAILFALYGVLSYTMVRWYDRPNIKLSMLIGLLMGIGCLCRPSEFVVMLVFLLLGISSWVSFKARPAFIVNNIKYLLLIAVAGAIAISPQVLYWHFNLGRWFYNGYEGHTFDFLQPHLYDGILGYRKGWVIYTPMMVFALMGLFTKQLKNKGLQSAVIAYFAINIYIVLSWHIWWYASSFGCRALVQSYAILALSFAAFTATAWQQKRWLQISYITIVIILVGFNQFQDWQYRHHIIPPDLSTKTYYWEVFGKTSISDSSIIKYMDVDEKLPVGKIFTETTLGDSITRMMSDTIRKDGYGGGVNYVFDANTASDVSGSWLRVNADIMSSGKLSYQYREAALVLSIERDGKAIKWTAVNFQRYAPPNQWNKVFYEIKLPKLQVGYIAKAYIWNQGPDTIYCRKMDLKLLQVQ